MSLNQSVSWYRGKDSTCGSGCRIDFPRCHSPPELVGKRLSDLYKKQLICSKPSFTGRKQFNFNEGENQNLTCQGKGKPTPKIKILTESGEVLAHGTGNHFYSNAVARLRAAFSESNSMSCSSLHSTGQNRKPLSFTWNWPKHDWTVRIHALHMKMFQKIRRQRWT